MAFNGSPVRQPGPPVPEPAWSWIGPALAGLIALATLGLITPLLLWYAFLRLRNLLSFAAALVASALVVVFALLERTNDLNLVVFLVLWLGGAGASFSLYRDLAVRGGDPAAEERGRWRRELRSEARRIAAHERLHAIELGIGRPDLGRGFDDGGLIDVNHVPEPFLAGLPLTPANLHRLSELRAAGVVFSSAEELAAAVDVNPRRVPELAEYAVFL
ncbi:MULTISPECIES: hypothetical protein [unclassified Nocardiopsis]|uniref:hypothetical protein n=1 Tax=Nocardiopsis TaxID=2013 RepID=UPI00387B93E5